MGFPIPLFPDYWLEKGAQLPPHRDLCLQLLDLLLARGAGQERPKEEQELIFAYREELAHRQQLYYLLGLDFILELDSFPRQPHLPTDSRFFLLLLQQELQEAENRDELASIDARTRARVSNWIASFL
jgi:hypothetical protein